MSIISKLSNIKAIKELKKVSELENEETSFINTGVASLNLLFSGKIDGGIPRGKISMLAAPSSLGKSIIGLQIARQAQKMGMSVLYIDTEFAFSKTYADAVKIDMDNLLLIQESRVEQVQTLLFQALETLTLEEKKNLLVIIDNWSNTTTTKTEGDIIAGKDTVDMTISRKRNNFARLLLGYKPVTMFIVNSVYASLDLFGGDSISGGSGIYYVSSSIVQGTSRAKNKDGTDIIGNIVTARAVKGRYAKENSKLKYLITYTSAIHPTFGLLDDLIEFGFVIKPSNGFYQRDFSKLANLEDPENIEEDKKWREKELHKNWAEWFKPLLKDENVKKAFANKYSYVNSNPAVADESLDDIF